MCYVHHSRAQARSDGVLTRSTRNKSLWPKLCAMAAGDSTRHFRPCRRTIWRQCNPVPAIRTWRGGSGEAHSSTHSARYRRESSKCQQQSGAHTRIALPCRVADGVPPFVVDDVWVSSGVQQCRKRCLSLLVAPRQSEEQRAPPTLCNKNACWRLRSRVWRAQPHGHTPRLAPTGQRLLSPGRASSPAHRTQLRSSRPSSCSSAMQTTQGATVRLVAGNGEHCTGTLVSVPHTVDRLGFAPSPSRKVTASVLPASAAQCKAVKPFCQTQHRG